MLVESVWKFDLRNDLRFADCELNNFEKFGQQMFLQMVAQRQDIVRCFCLSKILLSEICVIAFTINVFLEIFLGLFI